MSLPYKETKTFNLGGKVYPTEEAALRAAVEEVLGNPGLAAQVLSSACRLAPLLARACELNPGDQPRPA